MSDANKRLVRREVEEILNKGDFSVLEELIAEAYVAHDPSQPEPIRGRDAFRAAEEEFRAGFSNYHVRIDDQIAEGDRVVTRWTWTARHDGEAFGIPLTGRRVEMTGISIERIENGRIAEDWMQYDALGLMTQLGAFGDEAEMTA